MTTTREQFEQRLAQLRREAPELTRKDFAHLAGVAEKTVRNWLDADPKFADTARSGARRVQLFPFDEGAQWVRKQLFGADERAPEVSPGPRLAAEPQRMPHTPGERWRWVDMARLRGVTPTAVRVLAADYREHPERPFPPRDEFDHMCDAGEVSAWFLWYDTTRPGYTGPRPAEIAAESGTKDTRRKEVVTRLNTALDDGESLTSRTLAEELGVSADVAARYLRQAAEKVLPERGLISRSQIAERLPTAPAVLTPEQRRERVKTLLKRKSAPAPVITVADTPYYSETAIAEFLAPPA
ncbi:MULTISPECIES: hypothetical protein [Streptomyces]|uniref:hypothetical protein n=1 Tax=Streptomyces TaxID=1883 RepID=UPI0029BAFA48|nr:hypothetical protein [Streptomyces stelliscabiei]MDX2514593.1 hypothetical protein [Streptomyces stelliscabiei]MDX2661155.1 hypothetical protein [Streptomyces stelliscabiei]MDX2790132.1 hypothetical protein [Streptomyces stelliscabiei]